MVGKGGADEEVRDELQMAGDHKGQSIGNDPGQKKEGNRKQQHGRRRVREGEVAIGWGGGARGEPGEEGGEVTSKIKKFEKKVFVLT